MATHPERKDIHLLRIDELVGKPVVTAHRSKRLGRVADIAVDHQTYRVVGLLLRGLPFEPTRVLPYVEVQSLETAAVVVESDATVLPLKAWAQRAHVVRLVPLQGKRFVTAAGQDVGTVSDALVDPSTGDVRAFEIALPVAQTGSGRQLLIRTSSAIQFGADAVIVSDPVSTAAGPADVCD
jgi:uncharacterized protein YrrD